MSLKVEKKEVDQRPGVLHVASEHVQSVSGARQLVLKPFIKALSWKDWYHGISEPLKRAHVVFKNTDRMLGWFDLPEKIQRFGRALSEFKDSFSRGSMHEITKKTGWIAIRSAELSTLISSSIDIAYNEGLVMLTAAQLALIDKIAFLGSVSLFINAVVGIKKQIDILNHAEYLSPKYKLALFRIIAKTLLAVMGIFGMVTFTVAAGLIAKWVFLSVSTTFLLLSIGTHFYNEMVVKHEEKTLELKG